MSLWCPARLLAFNVTEYRSWRKLGMLLYWCPASLCRVFSMLLLLEPNFQVFCWGGR
jgi:hypothetical protein